MDTCVIAAAAHFSFARTLAAQLGATADEASIECFPDGESHVVVPEGVASRPVVVVHPIGPPANERLVELVLLMDATRRAGAARVIVVVPYLGYARQDRRDPGGAVGLRVVADVLGVRAADRLVVVDPHVASTEAAFSQPVEYVRAAPTLAAALGDADGPRVVVAPDLGAVKLAEQYSSLLGAPTAVVRKRRVSGLTVEAHELVGEVAGREPVIVDDMLSTGGTVEAAARLLIDRGCIPRVTVVVTHGLFVGPAVERLRALPLGRVVVTDTVPSPSDAAASLPLQTVSIAPAIANVLRRFLQ